jgi:hypothetical protein
MAASVKVKLGVVTALLAGLAAAGTFVSVQAQASNTAHVLAGKDPGALNLAPANASVPPVAWPRNKNGLTYGSEMQAATTDQLPDLILAIATNGKEGYVRRLDLYRRGPALPAQASAHNATSVRSIPVYAVDGTTVIGTYEIAPGGPAPRPGG